MSSTSALYRTFALPDGLMGSLAASPAQESDMSGSFQSGYDYSGTGVDRSGHGHSGYNPGGVFSLKSCSSCLRIIDVLKQTTTALVDL